MRKIYLVLLLFSTSRVFSQTSQSLTPPINSQLTSEFNPSLSANGRVMVLQAPVGNFDEGGVAISYQRGGTWSRPEQVPGITAAGEKVFNGTASLSHDANSIYFTSNRRGGIGGLDIWFVEKKGSGWTLPKNLGKPVNSDKADTDPSLSPDGKTLYFTRLTGTKGPNGEGCGKIFYSEKKGGDTWSEPKELPILINQGCECNPSILADNTTLTFASSRVKGKGHFDQYVTKLKDGKWSAPLPIEAINTPLEDKYISIPASGDYVYHTINSGKGTDVARTKLADNLKPLKMLLLQGAISSSSKLSLYAVNRNKYVTVLPSISSYFLLLNEKETFELMIEPTAKGFAYQYFYINLDTLKKFKELKYDVTPLALKVGSTFNLNNTKVSDSFAVENSSINELNSLVRLLKLNSTMKIEISTYVSRTNKDTKGRLTDTSQAVNTTILENERTGKISETVKMFLVSKGIAENRISTKGINTLKEMTISEMMFTNNSSTPIEIKVASE